MSAVSWCSSKSRHCPLPHGSPRTTALRHCGRAVEPRCGAYFDVHGLFLFFIFCLLVWESGRWMRSVRVSALRGQSTAILVTLGIVGFTLLGTLVLALMGYQAVLIGLPLLLWVGILF